MLDNIQRSIIAAGLRQVQSDSVVIVGKYSEEWKTELLSINLVFIHDASYMKLNLLIPLGVSL